MSEVFLPPRPEGQEIDLEIPAEMLKQRFDNATATVEAIRKANEENMDGRSSFSDVTGNLRSTIGPDLRAYSEEEDPEEAADALREARYGLLALEAYLSALEGNGKILADEMTEVGADPELRKKADDEAAMLRESAIRIYARLLAEKSGQMTEIEQ